MLRVADEDPNLVQIASKRVVATGAGRSWSRRHPEHSTELVGARSEVSRRAGSTSDNASQRVAPQGLLYDPEVNSPFRAIRLSLLAEPGRKPAPVLRRFPDGAHVAGPLAILNQGRLYARTPVVDGGKLRVIPVDWQGSERARYWLAALKDAYSTFLPDGRDLRLRQQSACGAGRQSAALRDKMDATPRTA